MAIVLVKIELRTGNLSLTLVLLIHAKLLQHATRSKQAGAIARGVVGEPNHNAVLGAVVLVLVLDDQALARLVVGLSLASPAVLNLVPLVVGRRLQHLNVTHGERGWLKRQRR